MASKDHRVILFNKLAEKLASKGLDNEIVEELMKVESNSLRKLADLEGITLRGEVHKSAFNFVRCLCVSRPNVSISSYFQAVQLFDFALQQVLDSDSLLGSTIARAAAAWLVSAKMLSQGPHMPFEQVVAEAEAFAGFPVMTCGDVQEKEKALLLSINISAPTFCTWYDLFSARLDAIFDGLLQESGHLQNLQKAYLKVLTVATCGMQVSAKSSAYMIAAGSFCFALAVTGLLPAAEVINPSTIAATQMPDNASIEAKSSWFSQCCGFEDLPASPVPAAALLSATQVAVHCSAQSMLLATTMLVIHFKNTVAEGLALRLFQPGRRTVEVPSVNNVDEPSQNGASLRLHKDFQEAFDDQDVPNELLEHWANIEKKCLEVVKEVPGTSSLMPLQVRDIVHRYLNHITQLVGLPVQKYFEAVTLLDYYHLKNPHGVSIETLAVTCSALVIILKKNDTATVHVNAWQLAPHAAQMAQWLQRRGAPNVVVDVSERMLLAAERKVMEVLEWRINVPTIESWISTLCVRFNVLTQSLFMVSLNWVWQQSLILSRMILTRQALSKETSPQKLAVGLLGLGLVAARLLPGDALRPSKIPSGDWERLNKESQPQGDMPQCVLPKDQVRCFLSFLQATVTWSLFELQEACYVTASVVRDGRRDIQVMQQLVSDQAQHMLHTSL